MTTPTDDLRIREIREVTPPADVHSALPISDAAATTVSQTRTAIHNILNGDDDRVLGIVGPCSIHDPQAAMEYAEKLNAVRTELAADLLLLMRVYFEKPRTIVGWKGLINDPNLDDTFEINKGLKLGRKLLLDVNEMGLPAGVEFLDLITPQYIADLVSWGAIGARTTESQGHRELSSGLSCPVGFKNGTDGTTRIAVDAMRSSARPHVFLSMTKGGHAAIFHTTGNEDTHVILRGGTRPNYDAESVEIVAREMADSGVDPRIMIDFSHANSHKQHEKQFDVGQDVAGQLARGDRRIIGFMIESHLVAGRQNAAPGTDLAYGQSITDACLAWSDTEPLLHDLAAAVRKRRTA